MKFERLKHTDFATIDGSSKMGELDVPESVLRDVFGEPDASTCHKTTMEWRLRFEDGTVATIYDWKGFRWSIGGHHPEAVLRVKDALKHIAGADVY